MKKIFNCSSRFKTLTMKSNTSSLIPANFPSCFPHLPVKVLSHWKLYVKLLPSEFLAITLKHLHVKNLNFKQTDLLSALVRRRSSRPGPSSSTGHSGTGTGTHWFPAGRPRQWRWLRRAESDTGPSDGGPKPGILLQMMFAPRATTEDSAL